MNNATNISDITNSISFTNTIMSLIPMIVMIGIVLFIISFMFYGDGFVFGRLLHRWYIIIPLVVIPFLVIFGMGDLMFLIIVLICITIGGALFFWFIENDFEMPKGDPVKKGFQWLRKNFRM